MPPAEAARSPTPAVAAAFGECDLLAAGSFASICVSRRGAALATFGESDRTAAPNAPAASPVAGGGIVVGVIDVFDVDIDEDPGQHRPLHDETAQTAMPALAL